MADGGEDEPEEMVSDERIEQICRCAQLQVEEVEFAQEMQPVRRAQGSLSARLPLPHL